MSTSTNSTNATDTTNAANLITEANISIDEVSTSPPGWREAQVRSFWSRTDATIIADFRLLKYQDIVGPRGVFKGWEALQAKYKTDFNFRRCLSITERDVIVAKLETDIVRLNNVLSRYGTTWT